MECNFSYRPYIVRRQLVTLVRQWRRCLKSPLRLYGMHFVSVTKSVDACGWQARDELLRENEQLRGRVELQGEQLSALRAHIGLIRQHTITFILDQMETLHMQRDTEVWRTAVVETGGRGRSAATWPHSNLAAIWASRPPCGCYFVTPNFFSNWHVHGRTGLGAWRRWLTWKVSFCRVRDSTIVD